MPPFDLRIRDPRTPEISALIAELDAYHSALYPGASNHLESPDELARDHVVFFAAYANGRPVGCGAVKLESGWGELKRLYVQPDFRRGGLAREILARLERCALDAGRHVVRLETGIHSLEAIAFYTSCGYARIGPFPPYTGDPLSVFMEKAVRRSPGMSIAT